MLSYSIFIAHLKLANLVVFLLILKTFEFIQDNQIIAVDTAQSQPPSSPLPPQSNNHNQHNIHSLQNNYLRSNASNSTTNNNNNNNHLNEYYESLRNNVITLLEHVRIPGTNIGISSSNPINSSNINSKIAHGAAAHNSTAAGHFVDPKLSHEHFDSYLSKLQSLCTPDGYCTDENRPIYDTVKSALQDFTVLPTAI